MAFNPDIFAQAAIEVDNKGTVSQIAHSRLFHSTRSAFSTSGSLASKTTGAAIGVGKLFLSLIPVPVVGALVGAAVDAMESGIRGKLHGDVTDFLEKKEKDKTLGKDDQSDLIKYSIKELTVENLDRYRWKVAKSIEELNAGLRAYNESTQNCDDFYAIALLSAQYQRRKTKLITELDQFRKVIRRVDAWIDDLDTKQGTGVMTQIEKIKGTVAKKIGDLERLVPSIDSGAIAFHKARHADCKNWCYVKRTATYDPNESWDSVKSTFGKVVTVMAPIAVTLISVKQGDFKNDKSNSSFKVQDSD